MTGIMSLEDWHGQVILVIQDLDIDKISTKN
jgi:hypothetical protein